MATNSPKRGEVWLVDMDPTRGQEIKKKRPVVVLSADPIGSIGLRIVVPLTGYKVKHDKYPWCIPSTKNPRNGLSKDSTADAYQVKCVSVERCIHRMGAVSADTTQQIAEAVALCIDL